MTRYNASNLYTNKSSRVINCRDFGGDLKIVKVSVMSTDTSNSVPVGWQNIWCRNRSDIQSAIRLTSANYHHPSIRGDIILQVLPIAYWIAAGAEYRKLWLYILILISYCIFMTNKIGKIIKMLVPFRLLYKCTWKYYILNYCFFTLSCLLYSQLYNVTCCLCNWCFEFKPDLNPLWLGALIVFIFPRCSKA